MSRQLTHAPLRTQLASTISRIMRRRKGRRICTASIYDT
jgi:hypothetical protein